MSTYGYGSPSDDKNAIEILRCAIAEGDQDARVRLQQVAPGAVGVLQGQVPEFERFGVPPQLGQRLRFAAGSADHMQAGADVPLLPDQYLLG